MLTNNHCGAPIVEGLEEHGSTPRLGNSHGRKQWGEGVCCGVSVVFDSLFQGTDGVREGVMLFVALSLPGKGTGKHYPLHEYGVRSSRCYAGCAHAGADQHGRTHG